MIGQFTSRFVGGLRTYQVFLALLIFPSIPLAIWFSVLYYYHVNSIAVEAFTALPWLLSVTFVINSLDSLIRLYTDNLDLTVKKLANGDTSSAMWLRCPD